MGQGQGELTLTLTLSLSLSLSLTLTLTLTKAGEKVFLPTEAALEYQQRVDEAAARAAARAEAQAAVVASIAAAHAAAAPNGEAQLPDLSLVYLNRTPIKNGAWKHPAGWLGL